MENMNVIISNHVSSIDPVVFLALDFKSFVAKDDVRSYPIFGLFTWATQGIFVSRENKNQLKNATQQIYDRINNDVQNLGFPRRFPVLTIFPESTAVNQTALLPFKKGAFMGGKPVSMVSLQYCKKYFDHSDASVSLLGAQIKALIGLWNSATVTYMGDYVPSEEEKLDAELYASNVREFYHQKLGWEKSECTLYDKQYYKGKCTDYDKCSDYYKTNFGSECTRKNNKQTDRK